MSAKISLLEKLASAFKRGFLLGRAQREQQNSLDSEEVQQLQEALDLERFESMPNFSKIDEIVSKNQEGKKMPKLKTKSQVHDPAGTRNDIEAGK